MDLKVEFLFGGLIMIIKWINVSDNEGDSYVFYVKIKQNSLKRRNTSYNVIKRCNTS